MTSSPSDIVGSLVYAGQSSSRHRCDAAQLRKYAYSESKQEKRRLVQRCSSVGNTACSSPPYLELRLQGAQVHTSRAASSGGRWRPCRLRRLRWDSLRRTGPRSAMATVATEPCKLHFAAEHPVRVLGAHAHRCRLGQQPGAPGRDRRRGRRRHGRAAGPRTRGATRRRERHTCECDRLSARLTHLGHFSSSSPKRPQAREGQICTASVRCGCTGSGLMMSVSSSSPKAASKRNTLLLPSKCTYRLGKACPTFGQTTPEPTQLCSRRRRLVLTIRR